MDRASGIHSPRWVLVLVLGVELVVGKEVVGAGQPEMEIMHFVFKKNFQLSNTRSKKKEYT